MKKANFYICMQRDGKLMAEKVSGYTDGEVGVHKTDEGWVATYLETGVLVVVRGCKSAAKAISKAQELLSDAKTDKVIAEHKKTRAYRQFDDSRYVLSKTEVI